MLDLHPVTAAAEDVQPAVVDPVEQGQRVRQRDDLVVAAVDDQCRMADRPDVRLGVRQPVDPALAGLGEHGGERLLGAGADTGLVAHPDQVVGDQRRVVREGLAHQSAHVLDRRLVAPDPVQTVGQLERDAGGAHQDDLVDPLGVVDGECQRHRAAERVADHRRFLHTRRVHEGDHLVQPDLAAVGDAVGHLGEAEAGEVRGEHPVLRRQGADQQPPVGPCADARPGAVEQQHRRAFADVVVVGDDVTGLHGPADLGVLLAHPRVSFRGASLRARCALPRDRPFRLGAGPSVVKGVTALANRA
ncbi:hypothetical protein SDC9_151198 [bioreactor metagenome]|uniref:Uncharacterized protein n=1 Tax=bioreactor metagenome TaxID=1076179 RepID=A0A645ETX1_9ZZZZ